MGMDRSTGQPVGTAQTKMIGMSIRSGYPDTVLIDDGLVINAAGIVNIVGNITHTSDSTKKWVHVYKNGILLQTAGTVFTVSNTVTVSNHSVVSGDRFELYSSFQSFSGTVNTCYLTVDLAA